MTLTLDLPPDLEKILSTEASGLGLPLTEYVLQVLSSGKVSETTLKTGADLVAYWRREGLIGTRSDIADSQRHARQIRDQALQGGSRPTLL